MPLDLGKKVPDFQALSTAGTFKLSMRSCPKLVLYFYPKDNTPGCSTQAEDFAQSYSAFTKAGCEIIGVSRDSLNSHENFRAKFDLPFALISDPEEALCLAFDVMKMKNMYGKQVRGIERSTFVIDADGKLAKAWRGLKVPSHVAEVLGFVQDMA